MNFNVLIFNKENFQSQFKKPYTIRPYTVLQNFVLKLNCRLISQPGFTLNILFNIIRVAKHSGYLKKIKNLRQTQDSFLLFKIMMNIFNPRTWNYHF